MLLKGCARCGNLIPYGATYCSKCLPTVEAEREARLRESRLKSNREYNKTRDPKYIRFYNSPEWRTLSAARLQGDGYRCVWCGRIATEVDHIAEIQTPDGWERRLDYNNTRSLCKGCHNRRHGRFKPKERRDFKSNKQK